MKSKMIVGPMLVGGFIAAAATAAIAGDSVILNGRKYTFTNTCSVTTTSTGYRVTDCCGGRVSMTIEPTLPPE